ncbi:MAG: PSD1 domain-containing protein [Planctomycetes bacterium]|nr:PSD1 domain-containing protein [Planctomycetota bacterium]
MIARRSLIWVCLVVLGATAASGGVFVCPLAAAEKSPAPAQIDFTRDVQPIFVKRCYSCHGPDTAEGSLRLDDRSSAHRGGNSGPAWVAGQSGESRLVRYVTAPEDEEFAMPPEGERLSSDEVALVRAWVDQGARWPEQAATAGKKNDHWSFQPVKRPEVPRVKRADWCRNPIDHFVLARLEHENITPSPEADRATLIRRLSLDLTGLPPTPAEVNDFVADPSAGAYERLVDRLLASPHYGERWARHWLDLARYADSDGYEKDTGRPHAWRWRNWVIDALNRDLPFDQFTVEQLAGDLLPGASEDQRIATGFHRNTLTNKEGGVDQEEYRVAATIDRVNTTSTVWMALTMGCAQCHTHKYDPIAQREYYELFAFFNNLQETDMPAPLPDQVAAYQKAKAAFDADHAKLVAKVTDFEREQLPSRLANWEREAKPAESIEWQVVEPAAMTPGPKAKTKFKQLPDGVVEVEGAASDTEVYTLTLSTKLRGITGLRLEALADAEKKTGPGRAKDHNFVLTGVRISAAPTGKKDAKPVTVPLRWAVADYSQGKFEVLNAIDADPKSGWAIGPKFGEDHLALFELASPIDFEEGATLVVTLDHQYPKQFALARFRLSLTTTTGPLSDAKIATGPAAVLAKPASARSATEQKLLADYYRRVDKDLSALDGAVVAHAKKAPVDPATTNRAMVLVDLPKGRETHVLVRGDFLRPGAKVEAGVPSFLPPIEPRGEHGDRLDLARWLVSEENPLTPRVTVNRIWGQHFGRPLVNSVPDFGTQGDRPTHPELLDWLADEFRQTWSMKQLHRLIVTSATYRQSSRRRAELNQRDPYNMLLAQQPRMRVEAEVVRDLALAVSGLIDERIGGPSVRPKQPDGVSELTYANAAKWVESNGADRYRRGMYTWFQRTSPYPMLMTFDSPDGVLCCARRERSNTPLQALTLLNDPVFVECSQALARRVLREAPAGDTTEGARDGRLRWAFQACLARVPSAGELDALRALYADQLQLARANADASKAIVGTGVKDEKVDDPAELAAWVMVGRTLLNLDEFITRE